MCELLFWQFAHRSTLIFFHSENQRSLIAFGRFLKIKERCAQLCDDADPDPTFYFDADPDLDPTSDLHMLENKKIIFEYKLYLIFFSIGIFNILEKRILSFIIGWNGHGSGSGSAGYGSWFRSTKIMPIRPDPQTTTLVPVTINFDKRVWQSLDKNHNIPQD